MTELLSAVVPILIPILGGLWGAISSFKFVREGQRALLLRFEKAKKRNGKYIVKHPGFTILMPWVNRLAIIHVRARTINLPLQTIVLADNTVFEIGAVILARVKDTPDDLYRALFETEAGVNATLNDWGMVAVREILSAKGWDDISGENRRAVDDALREYLQHQADEWGVEIMSFALSDCRPTPDTSHLIQMEAQAAFRTQALKAAAAQLGLPNVGQLGSTLAAVLVGMPMVASVSGPAAGTAVGASDVDVDD